MADIALRFNKDMLVLSAPLENTMMRQGIDYDRDWTYISLMEPESTEDAVRLESMSGAQCLVTPTKNITPAQLSHENMRDALSALARANVEMLKAAKPQHILCEIGPCGLPLDESDKNSLNENKDQYARAAKAFADLQVDGLFFNGFRRIADLKTALIGARKVCDLPIFASVILDETGKVGDYEESFDEALAVMQDFEAAVAGFEVDADLATIAGLASYARKHTFLPLLVQIPAHRSESKRPMHEEVGNFASADDMVEAALCLRAQGVQFLRATGNASPAYSAGLAAATMGLDVVLPIGEEVVDA
ncbi:MAG: homocysteine S-methyltransferase family protein [Eggerthellaceae bacterium]